MNSTLKSTNEAVPQHDLSLTGKPEPSNSALRPLRILLIHDSVRDEPDSRFLTFEAQRILGLLGAETRVFNPEYSPVAWSSPPEHFQIKRLRELSEGSDGHIWFSPEQHSSMSDTLKSQLDWLALEDGDKRLTQGKTLAVMQTANDMQSFNAFNQLRILGQHMNMVSIPSQLCAPKACSELESHSRMRPSSPYERLLDVIKEFYQFTERWRNSCDYLNAQYRRYKAE